MPKRNILNVKEGKLSPAMQDRFLRAEAANENSFVGLPLFAAAIVRCFYTSLSSSGGRMGKHADLWERSLETWPDCLPRCSTRPPLRTWASGLLSSCSTSTAPPVRSPSKSRFPVHIKQALTAI